MKRNSQQGAKYERGQHARAGRGQSVTRQTFVLVRPGFDSHYEQEQNKANLAQLVERPNPSERKSCVEEAGATRPKSDGPSNIPAVISPIHAGLTNAVEGDA